MRSPRLFVVSLMMLLALLVSPMVTTAQSPGNSGAAQACQQGGYLDYTDADGNPFRNTGQCVSYAAQGGTLVPVPTTAVYLDEEAWTIGATGFAPNSLLYVDRVFEPSGYSHRFLGFTDADGTWGRSDWNTCFELTNTSVTITVTDAEGVSHTEFFELDCGS